MTAMSNFLGFILAFAVFSTIILSNIRYTSFNETYYSSFYKSQTINLTHAKNILDFIKNDKPLDVNVFTSQAILHMQDVKELFRLAEIFLIISMLEIIFCSGYFFYKKTFKQLKRALYISCMSVLLTVFVIGVLYVSNFNFIFIKFHQLFFTNELWLFNQNDNLVKIFPEDFFIFITKKIIFNILVTSSAIILLTYLLSKDDKSTN